MKNANQGFTLIEVLVSFAILTPSLLLLTQIYATSIRQSQIAQSKVEAMHHLQNLVETIRTEERFLSGQEQGKLADKYQWTMESKKLEETSAKLSLEKYQVQVKLQWRTRERDENLTIETIMLASQ